MEAVFELLQSLASKGIKLSVNGNELHCYAEKGSLTQEIRNSIALNKSKIIEVLKSFQAAEALSDFAGKAAKSSVDLAAEAVLNPAIQPPDGDVDFAGAKTIFLTGASGFLGAYLLRDLMTTTEATLHCLVRCRSEQDGVERIKKNLLKYGLWNEEFTSRIAPVPGDLAQPLLGIGQDTFDALSKTIDSVYHNGAFVNFIYPYANLRDANVRGTEEVIRLACRTRKKPLHFVSTVGIFPPRTNREDKVLESDPASNWQELTDGYRQTKWVAEKIVKIACERGLPVRIYRPGFVTGDSATGIWNTDDFLPRMIKGCIQLGSAPDRDAIIDMVPVDYVSKAIVHLSLQPELQSNIFNIVNPRHIPASELGKLIMSLGYPVNVLSYAEWRNALFEDAKTSSKNALYPLLTMFTDNAPMDLVPAFDCQYTLKGLRGTQVVCPEINTDLMTTYLRYFKSSGFLES